MAKPKNKSNKSAAKRRGSKTNRVTVAERLRLGPDVAQIKSQLTPGQWKRVVADAHKGGFSVAGHLSGAPGPLKERTRSSLKSEALGQAKEAFAPGFAQLDDSERRLDAINARRASDEAGYQQWLSQRTSEIAAQQQAAQQRYEALAQQGIAAQQAQAQRDAESRTAQMANSGPADTSNSIYLKGAQERAQASVAKAQSEAQRVTESGPAAAKYAAAIQQSAIGQGQAMTAKRLGDYGEAMAGLRKDRLGLVADQTKTAISRWTSLLDNETLKANANRDYEGLMAQTQVKREQISADNAQFAMGLKAKERIAKRQASVTKRGQTLSAAERRADRESSATQKALDRAATARQKALDRAAKGDSAPDAKNEREQIAAIRQAANLLKGERGGKLPDPNNPRRLVPSRRVLRAMNATDDQINVALQIAKRGRLDARGIRRARILGISDPSKLL